MGLLAALIALYGVLHAVVDEPLPADVPGCTSELSWPCFAFVDDLGDLHLLSRPRVAWYVGAPLVDEVVAAARENEARLEALRRRVALRAGRDVAPLLIDRTPADALRRYAAGGRYAEAVETFEAIVDSLSTESANSEAHALAELRDDLAGLVALERRQQALARRLVAPHARLFLWLSPSLGLLEVLFWTLFGVVASVLLDVAEHGAVRSDGRPRSAGVHPRMLYGPILAFAGALAVVHGPLSIDRPEVRVWALPLVGFVLGFASRRIALGIDRLLERLSGARRAALQARAEAARRRVLIDRLMEAYRPGDWETLRLQLHELAAEVVEAEAAARERR